MRGGHDHMRRHGYRAFRPEGLLRVSHDQGTVMLVAAIILRPANPESLSNGACVIRRACRACSLRVFHTVVAAMFGGLLRHVCLVSRPVL